jgi:hypothetical protein
VPALRTLSTTIADRPSRSSKAYASWKVIRLRLAVIFLVLTAVAPLRATDKFRATTAGDSLPGRYLVALSDETAVDDAATLAITLVVSKPPIQTDSTPYVWKSAYRYDGTGNIIGIDRYGADGIGVAGSDYYVYDGVNRLVAATADTESSKNTAQYQYDRWGNLLTLSLTGSTESIARSFGVDPLSNRLDKPCSGQVSCYMAGYDNAGNVTSFSTTNYKWDGLGMMTELHTLSRHEFYIYDASNERIATLVLPPGGTQPQQYRYTLRGFDQKVLRELVHDVAPGRGMESDRNGWRREHLRVCDEFRIPVYGLDEFDWHRHWNDWCRGCHWRQPGPAADRKATRDS